MKCHTSASISLYSFRCFIQVFPSSVTRCAHSHVYKTQEHSLYAFKLSGFFFFFRTSTFTPSTFGIYPDNKSALLYTARVKLHSEYIIIICLLIGILRASLLHTRHVFPCIEFLMKDSSGRGAKKKEALFFFVFFTFQVNIYLN